MMKGIFGFAAATTLVLVLALTVSSTFYPQVLPAPILRYASPTGTDTGDCTAQASPCKTITYAVAQSPLGFFSAIYLNPGFYAEPGTITIYEFKRVGIFGTGTDGSGNCDATQVVISIPLAGPVLSTEDHATGIYQCLTLTASVPGATALAGRQSAILDFSNIRFGRAGDPPLSTAISAQTFTSANCEGMNWLVMPVVAFIRIDQARAQLSCNLDLPEPNMATYFLNGVNKGVFDATAMRFTGAGTPCGMTPCSNGGGTIASGGHNYPFWVKDTTIDLGNVILPGNAPGRAFDMSSVINAGNYVGQGPINSPPDYWQDFYLQ
jgi:hypothetical protein